VYTTQIASTPALAGSARPGWLIQALAVPPPPVKAEEPMSYPTTWEYNRRRVTNGVEDLNNLGADGWELCTVVTTWALYREQDCPAAA